MQTTATCRAPLALVARPCAARRAFAPAAAPRSRPLPRRQLRTAAAAADTQADAKYPGWERIFGELSNKYSTRTVNAEQAFDMVGMGKAVLIDVRPQEDHDKGAPKGSICVPAFLVINSPSSPGEFAKWVACKANGVVPTKPNAALPAEVAAAAGQGKAAILACEAGGTLTPSVNFPQGKVSRSLKAAWKVLSTGSVPADRVMHLDGGVYAWYRSGMPMTGEYDGAGAGRTPAAADAPK